MVSEQLTQERLKELLTYDPDTGVFRWRTRRGSSGAGKTAGSDNGKGYIVIRIDRRIYKAHRLAWLHELGRFPPADLDHINGQKGDNRIANLREATRSQNQANLGAPRNNTSGVKGVFWDKHAGKWVAQIRQGGRKHLGCFSDKSEAKAAYEKAARELFGDFARVE